VLDTVASRSERERLAGATTDVCIDRVLFSAKEAVYKAWFPVARRWLDFLDVDLSLDLNEQTFNARLLVPGPVVAGVQLTDIGGRWSTLNGFVGTAAVIGVAPA
jgi:4'-phosphopantetheinyl transferase EntD